MKTAEESMTGIKPVPRQIEHHLNKLDPFATHLTANNEVLATNADGPGQQAVRVARDGDACVYPRNLEKGSKAVGLFNLNGNHPIKMTAHWADLKISGRHDVRDLWQQRSLGRLTGPISMPVAAHRAELVKLFP